MLAKKPAHVAKEITIMDLHGYYFQDYCIQLMCHMLNQAI